MPRKAKEKEVKNDILNEKEELDNAKSSAVKVTKKTTSKSKPASTKKVATKKVSKTSSRTKKENDEVSNKPTKSKTKAVAKKSSKLVVEDTKATSPINFEYYDLPYRYNKTVIKLLAQNPNTLFVYWDIADEDRQEYINKYGENFFNITKPVLVVHNITDKYSFEIDINDFANNWYIHVENSKCQYVVELGRKPIEHTETISDNYLYVTSSNLIESPNDHVLFFKENDKIRFKNVHTNSYSERIVNPFLKNVCSIYNTLNITDEENSFDFNNPSSMNPSSNF